MVVCSTYLSMAVLYKNASAIFYATFNFLGSMSPLQNQAQHTKSIRSTHPDVPIPDRWDQVVDILTQPAAVARIHKQLFTNGKLM